MNNIYQALCGSVGASNQIRCSYTGNYCPEIGYHGYKCPKSIVKSDCECRTIQSYPPATAEQRERLEELILDKFEHIYIEKYNNEYIVWNGAEKYQRLGCSAKTRPDALYALTQKLRDEGVLGKEEVAKALKGGSDVYL